METFGVRGLRPKTLETAALAVAVFAAASTSILLTRDYTEVSAVWPVNAITLALLLRRDRRDWPRLLAAAYAANALANMATGNGWIIAVFCSAANLVEILVCTHIVAPRAALHDIGGGRFFLRLFAGAAAGALCSALIAAAAMSFGGAAPIGATFVSWFVSDALGLAIFAPAFTVLLSGEARTVWMGAHKPAYAALVWLSFIAGACLVFAQARVDLLPVAPMLLLPLAFTLEAPAVVLGVGILSVIAITSTALGVGPVAYGSASSTTFDLHYLQGILTLISLVGTPASAVIAQRQQLLRDVRRARDEALSANEALAEAAARAECAAQARAEFLANMSHELRTPLNSVIGYSRLLAQSRALTARDRRFAHLVESASEATLSIVNDVLDAAALDRGAIVLRPAPFSFRDVLAETAAMIAPLADAKGLAVEIDVDAAVATLEGDRDRFRQIALNLASHAIKFSPSGAVVLRVALEADARESQRVRLEVRDAGVGIAPEHRELVFERFAQVGAAQTGGGGLGLAIVKELANLMGAAVRLDSEVGVGTTVAITVTLPKGRAISVGERAAAAALAPQRVLVVDDVDLNRELAALLLTQRGHLVESAADGEEALARCEAIRFDVIFMDVRMPGMDGLEAARRIRAGNGASRRTPILALSAGVRPEQAAACLAAGMDGCVGKPISEEQLLAAMAECLRDRPAAAAGATPVESLRRRFVERLADERRALASSDGGEQFAAIVHRMAGAAGSLGFDDVGAKAAALDDLLAQGAADVDEALSQLIGAIDEELLRHARPSFAESSQEREFRRRARP